MGTFAVVAAALWALLVAPAPAQQPPRASGLSPLQVLQLRAVLEVHPSPAGTAVAFTRSEPRPASAEPGPAYVHLYTLERRDGAVAERLLLGGPHRVHGVAWDPQADRITFLHKGDDDEHPEIWAIGPAGGEPARVTQTAQGVAEYRWSPDGSQLAYTAPEPLPEARRKAREMGFRARVLDEDERPLSLWLWDRASGGSRLLVAGRAVFSFEWSPDGAALAAGIAPRNSVDHRYMHTRLHLVDAASGEAELLAENPGKLGAFAWSPDGRQLAYVSAADRNDPHAGTLWVVDRETRQPRCLTADLRGMVHDPQWITDDSGRLSIAAVIHRGVASHLATIDPETGAIANERPPCDEAPAFDAVRRATDERGRAAQFLVGSTPSHPPEVFGTGLTASGEDGFRRLTNSNPWLAGVALGKQEVRRVRARDGLEIEGLLLYPVDYREGARYPLVIVVHGGPESHYQDGWNTNYAHWGQMLCARGYFAWYPNYRSSTGYGVTFAKADHGDPMGREFTDHLDAIAHLDAAGLIDPRRVGIGGGSYGGYTAAWAAARHSEHFAAAVSFVPFVDLRTKWYTSDIPDEFYFVHYQEKWPHEQRGFLDDRSPLAFASRCRTPLLLLGGTSDSRVHPSQPMMMYRAVKTATDTPVRYVQYPGEGHGNQSNVYQYDYALRTLRWFDHYLRPGEHRSDPPPPSDLDYGAWGALAEAAAEPAADTAR